MACSRRHPGSAGRKNAAPATRAIKVRVGVDRLRVAPIPNPMSRACARVFRELDGLLRTGVGTNTPRTCPSIARRDPNPMRPVPPSAPPPPPARRGLSLCVNTTAFRVHVFVRLASPRTAAERVSSANLKSSLDCVNVQLPIPNSQSCLAEVCGISWALGVGDWELTLTIARPLSIRTSADARSRGAWRKDTHADFQIVYRRQ